jgi:hypothetical protein
MDLLAMWIGGKKSFASKTGVIALRQCPLGQLPLWFYIKAILDLFFFGRNPSKSQLDQLAILLVFLTLERCIYHPRPQERSCSQEHAATPLHQDGGLEKQHDPEFAKG